jgi:hypothetical protein
MTIIDLGWDRSACRDYTESWEPFYKLMSARPAKPGRHKMNVHRLRGINGLWLSCNEWTAKVAD